MKKIFKGKKALVTGGEGFIGGKLVKRLKGLGASVISIDQKNGEDITRWKDIEKHLARPVDMIFHLAAKLFIPGSWERPREFYEVNVLGTLNMLEFCRLQKGSKMIFTSSYLYGRPQYLPIDESHPVAALNPYGKSKLLAEELCRSYFEHFKVPGVILRVFNVYGEGQGGEFLIPKIIGQLRRGSRLTLENPRPRRDLIYVDDLIEALVKAAEYQPSGFDLFNIGSGKSYSVSEIAENVIEAMSKKGQIRYENKTRVDEIAETAANCCKAEKLLGWRPHYSLKEGLAKMIAAKGESNG